MITKKDGSFQFRVDNRKFNAVTEPDAFPFDPGGEIVVAGGGETQ